MNDGLLYGIFNLFKASVPVIWGHSKSTFVVQGGEGGGDP